MENSKNYNTDKREELSRDGVVESQPEISLLAERLRVIEVQSGRRKKKKKPQVDEDGFIRVERGKKSFSAHHLQENVGYLLPAVMEVGLNEKKRLELSRKIIKTVTAMKNSRFFVRAIQIIEKLKANWFFDNTKIMKDGKDFEKVVCYALGNFSVYRAPMEQLACLILIRDHFKLRVEIFDPIFTEIEKYVLEKELKFKYLTNTGGRYNVGNEPTLFFIPHGAHQLTNNLLYSNWDIKSLGNILLINNSLESLTSPLSNSFPIDTLKFIANVKPALVEKRLTEKSHIGEPFDSLAVHYFKHKAMKNFSQETWKAKDPNYQVHLMIDPHRNGNVNDKLNGNPNKEATTSSNGCASVEPTKTDDNYSPGEPTATFNGESISNSDFQDPIFVPDYDNEIEI